MFKISYTFRKLRDRLRDMIGVLRDTRKPMFAGAREARAFLRQWYDSHGEGEWPGLSGSTKKMRRRRWGYYRKGGGGSKTLRWSGGMRRSIFQRGAEGHIERWSGKGTLVFGSDYRIDGRPVVVFHDQATGKKGLPRRRMYPMDRLHQVWSRAFYTSIQTNLGFRTIAKRR